MTGILVKFLPVISTLHIFVTILKNNLKCAILYGPKETYRWEAFHE